MTLFEKVIERDWYLEHEAIAKRYLAEKPDGSVRPYAQIVATMARARTASSPTPSRRSRS